jgi:hypothetical protein
LGHVALKVDKLTQDVLVVSLHGSETTGHFIVTSGQVIDLSLKGFEGASVFNGWIGSEGWGGGVDIACRILTSGRDFAFDVLQGVSPVGVEIGMTECPTL